MILVLPVDGMENYYTLNWIITVGFKITNQTYFSFFFFDLLQ